VKKGANQVITSTLLILISIIIATIFYNWASVSTATVAEAIYVDAERAKKEILSDVTILTPPPFKEYDSNQPVFIHNSGSVPLPAVSIIYLKPNSNEPSEPIGIILDTKGNISNIKKWPIKQFSPGEVIIIWLPPAEYTGYTIVFTSRYYTTSKTIGVP